MEAVKCVVKDNPSNLMYLTLKRYEFVIPACQPDRLFSLTCCRYQNSHSSPSV